MMGSPESEECRDKDENQHEVTISKDYYLGVYHADDAGGFSVKGTCVTNYTESKSISKTVRKPGEMLPEVLKAGKIALRNVLTGIATKESLLTGRLNKDVVLLRVL